MAKLTCSAKLATPTYLHIALSTEKQKSVNNLLSQCYITSAKP